MKTVALVFFLISNFALAGGVICKQCPAESNSWAPRPSRHENLTITQGLAPHCAPYFKLKDCQEQCSLFIDDQNTIINQPCVDSCLKQTCR